LTRALVIRSALPRHHAAEAAAILIPALERSGWIVETGSGSDAASLRSLASEAVGAGTDVVVAIGGDGMVLQVASALAGSQVALAIVPRGTGNVLASNLGFRGSPLEAARAVTAGRKRSIDLGRIVLGDRESMFAVATGVGFDARVMASTADQLKQHLGKLAYVAVAVAASCGLRNEPHQLVVDGRPLTVDAAQVFVANFGGVARGVRPRWSIKEDDGLLDVLIARASGPLGGALAAVDAFGPLPPNGRVVHMRARNVRIESTHPQLVEADGDVIGTTPVVLSVLPGALTVAAVA